MADLAAPLDATAPGADHDCSVSSSEAKDARCLCGSLLARYVQGGVELKCRRCKRTVTIPIDAAEVEGGEHPVRNF